MVPKESVIVAALQRGKKIKPSTSQTSQMKLHGGPLFFGARHLGKWSQSSRSLTFFHLGMLSMDVLHVWHLGIARDLSLG